MLSATSTRRQPSQHLLDGVLSTMAVHGVTRFDASQFSTRQLLAPTCEDRALVRALAEGLRAYRLDATTWTVPSGSQTNVAYTVRVWGTRLACSCECGKSGGATCKHRSLVAHELAKQPKPAVAAKPECATVSTLPAKPAATPIRSIADLYDEA